MIRDFDSQRTIHRLSETTTAKETEAATSKALTTMSSSGL
jgi:hypothetical protein